MMPVMLPAETPVIEGLVTGLLRSVISETVCVCDAAAKSPVADVAAVPSPSVVRAVAASASSTNEAPKVEMP